MSRASTFLWGLVLTALFGQAIRLKTGQVLDISNYTKSPLIALLPFVSNVDLPVDSIEEELKGQVPSTVSAPLGAQRWGGVENNEEEAIASSSFAPSSSSMQSFQSLDEFTEDFGTNALLSSEPPVESPSQVTTMHTIQYCNGVFGNAHFREKPTFASKAILGAIKAGDGVQLTGKQVYADGGSWHEAIAPMLYPTTNQEAQNILDPNQTGWIASCFVQELVSRPVDPLSRHFQIVPIKKGSLS